MRSRPNSCKLSRSHSAPLFLPLLRNSSHRIHSDERRDWSILPHNPFKQSPHYSDARPRYATRTKSLFRNSNSSIAPQKTVNKPLDRASEVIDKQFQVSRQFTSTGPRPMTSGCKLKYEAKRCVEREKERAEVKE